MLVTIKFRSHKEEEKQITIKCNDADGNIVKESSTKHTGSKSLLKMITQVKAWSNAITGMTKAKPILLSKT